MPHYFNSITYIWPKEWNTLGKFMSLDTEVKVIKIEEESGHVTFISVPGIAFAMYSYLYIFINTLRVGQMEADTCPGIVMVSFNLRYAVML